MDLNQIQVLEVKAVPEMPKLAYLCLTVESSKATSILKKSLLAAQKYNINAIYKRGSQMCVALMSLPEDQGEHENEFQVFALELEQINPLDHIMLNDDKLAISQKAAEQDPVIQDFEECDSL